VPTLCLPRVPDRQASVAARARAADGAGSSACRHQCSVMHHWVRATGALLSHLLLVTPTW